MQSVKDVSLLLLLVFSFFDYLSCFSESLLFGEVFKTYIKFRRSISFETLVQIHRIELLLLFYFVDLIVALFFVLEWYVVGMTKVNYIFKFLRGHQLSFIVVSENKSWTDGIKQLLHNFSGFLSFLNHERWREICLLMQRSLLGAEFWWFYGSVFFLKYLWIVLWREIQQLRTVLLLSRWRRHRVHRIANAEHQVGRHLIFASSSDHWAVKLWQIKLIVTFPTFLGQYLWFR